ncbi:MAG: hypothetical protein N4A35_07345 [Flavobacteriales bacterium]|nr:hypothetical protein [Flavobacteriales bacterium]
MKKSVVILVYSLAPRNGVGARRWQKFALELANLNYNVYIVGANDVNNEYLSHKNIEYKIFDSKYPKVLDRIPTNFVQKISYHLAVKKQEKQALGATYDRATLDKKEIVNLLSKLVEENEIKNLIVSGAPFSLLYYGTIIKERFPSLNLISDIRDAWTWGVGYGMQQLSVSKKKHEKFLEQSVVKKSDYITVASEDLKIELLKKYSAAQEKTTTLLNGIEFDESYVAVPFNSDKIVITHIGSVNSGVEKYWIPFLNLIKQMGKEVVVKFIGRTNLNIVNYVSSNKIENVEFIKFVQEQDLKCFFEETHFVLMFKKDGFENTFPSKYFDYIKYEKPIIAFTKEGAVATEIVQNDLGSVFDEYINQSEFIDFLELYKNKPFNQQYDKHKFSIENLILELERKIK